MEGLGCEQRCEELHWTAKASRCLWWLEHLPLHGCKVNYQLGWRLASRELSSQTRKTQDSEKHCWSATVVGSKINQLKMV